MRPAEEILNEKLHFLCIDVYLVNPRLLFELMNSRRTFINSQMHEKTLCRNKRRYIVGNKATRRISKRVFQKKTNRQTNKASQKAMFVFRKIWLALFYFETPVLRFVLFCLITDDMLFYSVMFSVSICFFLCFLFVCVCFVKDFFHLFCSLSRQVGGGASK